jgi:hypothetical protein
MRRSCIPQPAWLNYITLESIDTYCQAVHFVRILQWWGKTAKGPIFLALSPQDSMRSPKVWIWVSEIAFPALWKHILKKYEHTAYKINNYNRIMVKIKQTQYPSYNANNNHSI